MKKLIEKQKRFKKLSHFAVVLSAVLIFIYIGAEPYLKNSFGNVNAFQLALFVIVLVSLSLLFLYESRYSKVEKYLENASSIISDAGWYITSREEKSVEDYYSAVVDDALNMGYKCEYNLTVNDFTFDCVLSKSKEFIYLVKIDEVDKNDLIAFLDSATYDVMSLKLRQKGDAVVMFICNKADESAIELSKDITVIRLGRYKSLHFANAICEVSSKKVFFLGNVPSKCQQMIANYAMNCDVPIKEKCISAEKLPFQNKLKEELDGCEIKDIMNKIDERF